MEYWSILIASGIIIIKMFIVKSYFIAIVKEFQNNNIVNVNRVTKNFPILQQLHVSNVLPE